MAELDPAAFLIPEAERRRRRDAAVAAIPAGYRPWLHLGATTAIGLGIAALCLAGCGEARALDWLVVPAQWTVANAAEWRFHRDLLHRRVAPFELLYDMHTATHHMIYVDGAMAIASWREVRLVLLPWWAILAIAAIVAPFAAAVGAAFGRPAGLLFAASSMIYVVAYEWMHTSFHLPEGHPVARWGLIRWLAQHHSIHHDPRRMRTCNFNVVVPLWDRIRGTSAGR
ncbi:MAG TPA: sterol desaturase family protein [Nannocystaceae bacterium]|nr:sterol desaturase family protein [Nannocystaceae bacterium]